MQNFLKKQNHKLQKLDQSVKVEEIFNQKKR